MNVIALLVGLGPLLGWGLFPTIASKIGGRPVNQLLGTGLGTLLFAIVFAMATGTALATGPDLWWSIVSGIGWGCAQIITFYCFTLIGSSRAMPVTTAFQLIGASLFGVIALGEWAGVLSKVIGFIALAVIVFGAYLTVWSEHKSEEGAANLKKATILLAVGELGYLAYSAAPRLANWPNGTDGMVAFLPQAIGILIVGAVYALIMTFKDRNDVSPFADPITYKQIVSGLFFAFAALTYLISAQPNMNGVATGFVLSQTSVVLCTLTGIWFLGQKKTKREMVVTVIGLVLIIGAAAATVMM